MTRGVDVFQDTGRNEDPSAIIDEDAHLVISAIDGLREEIDLHSDDPLHTSFQDSNGLSHLVYNWAKTHPGLRVSAEDKDVVHYWSNGFGTERYELYGEAPKTHSSVSIRVFAESGRQDAVFYFLKGENVEDVHRMNVVRSALGLSEPPAPQV